MHPAEKENCKAVNLYHVLAEKKNLCLYRLLSEKWEVPVEEMQFPAQGINFARDEMSQKDWLSLVAVHSDGWSLSVAF